MSIRKDAAGKTRTKIKKVYPSPVSFRMDPEDIHSLQRAAAKRNISVGELVRAAIRRHLEIA